MKLTQCDDAKNPMITVPKASHTSELAERLLIAVQRNDKERIEQLVSQNVGLLTYEYSQYDGQNILIIASNDQYSMDKVGKATITTLIDLGAKYNEPTKIDHWEAIHYTALNANREKMEAILHYLTPEEINSLVYCSKTVLEKYSFCSNKKVTKTYSNNALSILLKYGNQNGQFKECCELLVQSGINVHQADSNGVTPSDLIWKMRDSQFNAILKTSGVAKQRAENGFGLIRSNNINKFLSLDMTTEEANSIDGINKKMSSCTLLQLCCAKGFKSCVVRLLEKGALINRILPKNPNSSILIAIKEDHEEIVKLLLQRHDLELAENILIQLHIMYQNTKSFETVDKYVKMILKHLRRNKNISVQKYLLCKDELNRTALHYATHYRCSDNVLTLLSMGASLIEKDVFGNTPLHFIEPNVLEKFFDKCVDIVRDEDPSQIFNPVKSKNRTYSVKINYETLIAEDRGVQEAEFLRYMSKVTCLNRLMNHPVVAIFLALKWQKVKWSVYMNLTFYLLAYISLFSHYKFFYDSNGGKIFLMIAFSLLLVRELLQVLIMRAYYIRRIESILDLSLIAAVTYIIASGWFKILDNQNLLVALSVAFLTSTIGIFLQLGNLSFFTIKVIILRQISINFFKYMVFYMFPVLAFSFCFFMLSEVKENLFFKTLYETITMFAGDPESEFPDQKFESNPIFGHIIYIIFIILIGIILHNLLIGLAVSDLQTIQRQAEFMDKKERSKYITNIEAMIFNKYKKSICFKFIFTNILNFLSVFKYSRVLIIQSYDSKTIYVKESVGPRKPIQNKEMIEQVQSIFENFSLKNREIEDPYSLKNLHAKLQKLETLVLEKINTSKSKKKK